jgi:hypothetical protein
VIRDPISAGTPPALITFEDCFDPGLPAEETVSKLSRIHWDPAFASWCRRPDVLGILLS